MVDLHLYDAGLNDGSWKMRPVCEDEASILWANTGETGMTK